MSDPVTEIEKLLASCTTEQRREVFRKLRLEFPIHSIEKELNTQAEVILEAIHRAPDLTLRGIRGIIAEATFAIDVLPNHDGWKDATPPGNNSYDYRLEDAVGAVRLQIKMQRLKGHRPMMAQEAYHFLPADMYVVETQRTRGGRDAKTGRDTRPYKFGEFDILAVSLHPSTNDWRKFLYTVASWLLPRNEDTGCLLKFQPVPKSPNEDWTDNFETCVGWLRSGVEKKIFPGPVH
jgi:hypothetical protein